MGCRFLSWAIDDRAVKRALAYKPAAVMLSFGDPRPFADLVREAGAILMIQVTDVNEARQAVDSARRHRGAGTEAGGRA